MESTDSVNFDVRADEVVTGAKVTLQYSYSPALLTDLSQINVMVNDEVAASLPLPKENAGQAAKATVEIPAHLITEFNRLSLQFIGHYTMAAKTRCTPACGRRSATPPSLSIRKSPLAAE